MAIRFADDKSSITVGAVHFPLTKKQADEARQLRDAMKAAQATQRSKLAGIVTLLGNDNYSGAPMGGNATTYGGPLRDTMNMDTLWTQTYLDDVDAKLLGAVEVCKLKVGVAGVREIQGDARLSNIGRSQAASEVFALAMGSLDRWLSRAAAELVGELREVEDLVSAALAPEKIPGQDAAVTELRSQEIRGHFFKLSDSDKISMLLEIAKNVGLEQHAAVTCDPVRRLRADKRILSEVQCELIVRQGGDFVLVEVENTRDRLDAARLRMAAVFLTFKHWAETRNLDLSATAMPWFDLIGRELTRSDEFLTIPSNFKVL